jgi:hypothetical protein
MYSVSRVRFVCGIELFAAVAVTISAFHIPALAAILRNSLAALRHGRTDAELHKPLCSSGRLLVGRVDFK